MRFWFRYVHPNRSQLEHGGAQIILNNQVLPELDLFTGLAFEEVCRQNLWSLGSSGQLSIAPLNIGSWWNSNEEIDLVVLGETGAMLAECKWSSKAVGSDILANLERKTSLIRPGLACWQARRRIRSKHNGQYVYCRSIPKKLTQQESAIRTTHVRYLHELQYNRSSA